MIKLGLVVTYQILIRFDHDKTSIISWIEQIVANSNYVYGVQLGINFIVEKIVFMSSPATSRGKEWNGCTIGPLGRLYSFAIWLRDQKFYSRRTMWHLFGDCFLETGVIGIAFRQTLCSGWGYNSGLSNYEDTMTWVSFAHETGHIIGAPDAPKSGLMSRGTRYKGIFQFNPQVSRDVLCRNLNLLLYLKKCNGILAKGTWAPTASPTLAPTGSPTQLEVVPPQPQTAILRVNMERWSSKGNTKKTKKKGNKKTKKTKKKKKKKKKTKKKK